MTNVGAGNATRAPGVPNARSAESSTSSEPQPVTTSSGETPTLAAIASRSASLAADG